MWYSTHSTGIKQFDDDHQKIDSLLKKIARTSDPESEQEHLNTLCSLLQTHINNKKKTAEFKYLPDDEIHDILFLQEVKRMIFERKKDKFSKLNLIKDLHQMLADHVFKICKRM